MNIEARLRIKLRANGCTSLQARSIIKIVQAHFAKYSSDDLEVRGLGLFTRTSVSGKDSYYMVPDSRVETFILGNSAFKFQVDSTLIEFLLENGVSEKMAIMIDKETKQAIVESLKEDGRAIFRSVFTMVRTTNKAYAVYAPQ